MSRSGILTGKFRASAVGVKVNKDPARVLIMEERFDNARDLFSGLPLICDELEAWQAVHHDIVVGDMMENFFGPKV